MSDFVAEHLGLYLENASNIGRAAELVSASRLSSRPRVWWPPLGPAEDGFLEIDRHTMSDKDRNNFERMMAARRQRPPEKDYGSEASFSDALRRMVLERSKVSGATPVLGHSPDDRGKEFLSPSESRGRSVDSGFFGHRQVPGTL